MGIKVINEIKIVDWKVGEPPALVIKSHWSNKRIVTFEIGEKSYDFAASDLIKAIANATNGHDY